MTSEAWTILTTRYGREIAAPSDDDLAAALNEVYHEEDEEHPNAWLRLGANDGPLYVLDVYSSGHVEFSHYADADMEQESTPAQQMHGVPLSEALELWRRLARGDVAWVQARAWRPVE